MNPLIGVGWAAGSALSYAAVSIFARLGLQGISPIGSSLITMWFSLLPAAALALLLAWDDLAALPLSALPWLAALAAVNFLVARTLGLVSIDRIGATRSTTIRGTSAVFAAIFAIAITGERPGALVLLGTLVVVVGLAVALERGGAPTAETDRRSALWGYLIAVGSAIGFGGTNVLARHLTESYGSPLMISALSMLFGIAMLSPLGGREALRSIRALRSNPRFFVFTALTGLAAGIGVITMYYSVSVGPVTVVSPIIFSSPLLTIGLSLALIPEMENITRRLTFGTALTIGGVIMVVLGGAA